MNDKLILMVEDNPDDVALTARAFKKAGITSEVAVARDGVEALEFLFCEGAFAGRDPRQAPVLVLLDLKLPRLDGLEVLRRIRRDERTRHLPVVILTTSQEDQDLVTAYGLGCNSYIRKPVDYEEFVGVVTQVGAYWLVLNESPRLPNPR